MKSYIAVPLVRRTGEFFGTLCALDQRPSEELETHLPIFYALANLIALELEEEEAARERELFTAVLAHDLRNPLAASALGVQVLAEVESLSPTGTEVIGRIRSSLEAIETLVNDLMDVARGRFGVRLALDPSDFDLGALVREVTARQGAGHASIVVEADDGIVLRGDRPRIAQVLSNLVGNAAKATPPDNSVRVTVRELAAAIEVEVHNWGPPIAREHLLTLFEPFRRAEYSSAEDGSGLGLGLYIALTIAKAHEGAITVNSDAWSGTSFTLQLPQHNHDGDP